MDKYPFLSVKIFAQAGNFKLRVFMLSVTPCNLWTNKTLLLEKPSMLIFSYPLYTQWKSVSGSHVSVYGIATQVDVPASWWGPSTQRPIHFGKSVSQSENHLTVCLAKGNTYFNLVIKFCSTSLLYATDKELFWLAFSEF